MPGLPACLEHRGAIANYRGPIKPSRPVSTSSISLDDSIPSPSGSGSVRSSTYSETSTPLSHTESNISTPSESNISTPSSSQVSSGLWQPPIDRRIPSEEMTWTYCTSPPTEFSKDVFVKSVLKDSDGTKQGREGDNNGEEDNASFLELTPSLQSTSTSASTSTSSQSRPTQQLRRKNAIHRLRPTPQPSLNPIAQSHNNREDTKAAQEEDLSPSEKVFQAFHGHESWRECKVYYPCYNKLKKKEGTIN